MDKTAKELMASLLNILATATRRGVQGKTFIATFTEPEEAHAVDALTAILQWIKCEKKENTDDPKVVCVARKKPSPPDERPKRRSKKGIFFPVLSEDVRNFMIAMKREAKRRGVRFPDVVLNIRYFADDFAIELKPQVERQIRDWRNRSRTTSIVQQVCVWDKARKEKDFPTSFNVNPK